MHFEIKSEIIKEYIIQIRKYTCMFRYLNFFQFVDILAISSLYNYVSILAKNFFEITPVVLHICYTDV